MLQALVFSTFSYCCVTLAQHPERQYLRYPCPASSAQTSGIAAVVVPAFTETDHGLSYSMDKHLPDFRKIAQPRTDIDFHFWDAHKIVVMKYQEQEFGNRGVFIDGLGHVHDGVQQIVDEASQYLEKSTSTCSCTDDSTDTTDQTFASRGVLLFRRSSLLTVSTIQFGQLWCTLEMHCLPTADYPTESTLLSVHFGRWFGSTMVFALARLCITQTPSFVMMLADFSLYTARFTTGIDTDP